jgi:predicted nucleic acid-binding protein
MPSAERGYVLDAFALLRLSQDEPGAEKVARIMTEAQAGTARLLLHIVNLGEVVYSIGKRFGWDVALRKRAEITLLPITVVSFTEELFWQAVKLKSRHALSYAACFAAALALHEKATLVTGDPEFDALGKELALLRI